MGLFRRKKLTEDEKRNRMARAYVEWYLHQAGWADYRAVIAFEKELGLL